MLLANSTDGPSALSAATLACLDTVQKLKNKDVSQHAGRVGQSSVVIAKAIGLEDSFAAAIGAAANHHDIGKVVIPDAIMLKPGPLTPDEWVLMKSHCRVGHDILKGSGDAVLALAASIALLHHEACDGTGYPHGLTCDQIPIEARIVGLCDVYDALREDRPYRKGFGHEVACDIILKGDARTKPSRFDPDILSAFSRVHHQLDKVFTAPLAI